MNLGEIRERLIGAISRRDRLMQSIQPTEIVQAPVTQQSEEPSKREQMLLNNQPFPWGLTTPEERAKIRETQAGAARVTHGTTIPSAWELISDERADELVRRAQGIMRATSGLAGFEGGIFDRNTAMRELGKTSNPQ